MDCFKVDQSKNLYRLFNALPYNVSVDIYYNGQLVVADLKYKEFTSFKYGEPISNKIDIYEAGTKTNPLIRTTIKLPAEQIFTIAITGNKGSEALLVIEEDITQQPSNKNAVARIINLSPDLPKVDVEFNGFPTANNIEYRDETLYEYFLPDQYNITVEESDTEYPVKEEKFEFKVERIYTIYILGELPNIELLQSVDGNTYACL